MTTNIRWSTVTMVAGSFAVGSLTAYLIGPIILCVVLPAVVIFGGLLELVPHISAIHQDRSGPRYRGLVPARVPAHCTEVPPAAYARAARYTPARQTYYRRP